MALCGVLQMSGDIAHFRKLIHGRSIDRIGLFSPTSVPERRRAAIAQSPLHTHLAAMSTPLSTQDVMPERATVYYDGGCPVCAREIGVYRRRPGADSFVWVDVTQADAAAFGPGLSREAAMARMHVRRTDGTIVDGAAAFAEIWRGMPGLRWLGRLLGLPPFGALATCGYGLFLRARKLWR